MSGIAGIYYLDGRPVNLDLLTRMTDVIAHRGPDGVGHWIDGSVGLGHRMLHTTPESLQEQQPLPDETGNLCLTLDGRVDNRDELRATLEAKGAKLRTDTDAEMVLQAYKCWGEECLKKIIGDFAFVIWDRRNRQLFCARDFLGMKPFYYYTDGRTFLWGSEPQQFFEDSAVKREPNEGMIGEYLACAITNNEETLYQNIFRLPPAHFLLIKPDQFRKERYWDIDPAREIRYRTDAEYAEHFSELFKEAVRCRLRSHRPVGAYLSGGLDSSSVVGMTQSLFREGIVVNPGFETFSMVFPGLPCDESAYIQDVVQMWGIKSNVVYPQDPEASCYAKLVCRYHDLPDYPNGSMSYPLKNLARERGCRVLLTGIGGDHWLTGSFYHYADLLRQFRIPDLIRQVCFNSIAPTTYLSLLPVLKFGFWSLLPQNVRRVLKWVMRSDPFPSWMDAKFAHRIQLSERICKKNTAQRFSSFAQKDIYNIATCAWQTHSDETEERSASWFGLEVRHPFNDQRFVEFGLALPEEQRWRGEQTKFVLRQAMQGLLPEIVRQRLTKAEFSPVFVNALRAQGGDHLFDSLTIPSMGWVNKERLRVMYRQMAQLYAQGNETYKTYVWQLWMSFAVDLWFKMLFLSKKASSQEQMHTKKDNILPV